MRLEDLKQEFPTMPEEMREMIEREVEKQVKTEQPQFRRGGRTAGKVVAASLAAVMLLGTSVYAGVRAYHLQQEKTSDYSVTVKTVGEDTADSEKAALKAPEQIPNIRMEVGYLPDGMVETEDGKYSYAENLYKGGVSIVFYKMDTGDAQFEMLTTNVKETETIQINGYDGVYFVLHGGEGEEVSFNQRIYVAYTDVHYVMELFAASDVSKEEALKIAKGTQLKPVSDENTPGIVHAFCWSEYLKSNQEAASVEAWNPSTSIPKSAMANTHAVGEPFAAVQTPSEDHIEINVTDVQIRDEVSLLDLSVLDHEDRENLQRELDSSGKLLPVKINYIKYGDGIHSLNEVVDSREVPQKLLYVTVPMLTPTTFFVLIMLTIQCFKVFDLVYVMTGGGPGNATKTLVNYIYEKAFTSWEFGPASAGAIVLFAIVLAITLIQFSGEKKWSKDL